MGRIYSISFADVAITAAQDLISVQTTAGMAIAIHSFQFGQRTQTTVENVKLTFKRFSGAYSIGSSGSSATPAKTNFGDSAATCTGRINDTTQTTSGTAVTLLADVINEVNGYQQLWPPEDRPIIAISQAFIVSLDTAPGGSRTCSGTLIFEELF